MNKKLKVLLMTLLLMLIIGKTNIVNAETYNVALNGVDYTCNKKTTSAGTGMPKSSYSSSEEAKIDCTKYQTNFINSINEIRIFDDPSTCTFEETPQYYNCNCRATVYHECVQVNSSQKPTYSEKHTIEVKFMNESNSLHDKQTCDVTSSNECSVKAPSYTCSTGSFNGWVSEPSTNCSNGEESNQTLHFSSSGKIHTYYTYYPCCRSVTNNNSNNANNNANANNPTDVKNNSNDVTNDNKSEEPQTTEQEKTIQENPVNNQENPTNNEEGITTKKDNIAVTIILILLGILILTIIAFVIIYIYKKKSNNKKDDNNKKDNPYENYYNKDNNYYK